MFKNLFGVNGKEENLKGLLEAILKIKIESLEIQNPELPREHKNAKLGILDVRAKLSDGTIASIEMQVKNQNNIGERITFYVSKLYISTITKGQQYEEANKTIAIAMINFSYFNRKEYHQIAHLNFEECTDKNEIVEEVLQGEESSRTTDKLEIHIIDLQKFQKIKNPKGDLADWLNLILGNEEAIEMASQKNERIAKVNEENKRLSASDEIQDFYLLDLSEQMAILDENTRISVATKKGRAEGRAEGKAEGKAEGRREGEKKKQLEIAKNLLKIGIKIEDIEKATGLTKEDIMKLK